MGAVRSSALRNVHRVAGKLPRDKLPTTAPPAISLLTAGGFLTAAAPAATVPTTGADALADAPADAPAAAPAAVRRAPSEKTRRKSSSWKSGAEWSAYRRKLTSRLHLATGEDAGSG